MGEIERKGVCVCVWDSLEKRGGKRGGGVSGQGCEVNVDSLAQVVG